MRATGSRELSDSAQLRGRNAKRPRGAGVAPGADPRGSFGIPPQANEPRVSLGERVATVVHIGAVIPIDIGGRTVVEGDDLRTVGGGEVAADCLFACVHFGCSGEVVTMDES
ncbi:MAG: hypothetical protein ACOYB0_08295 [Polynucleobacter sp.]